MLKGNAILSILLKIFFICLSSDFSDLPDMTDEYIDMSVYGLTGLLTKYLIRFPFP